MSGPFQGDVHVSVPLTNISTAYRQDDRNFIADRFAPIIPVAKQFDQYWVYDRADWNRDQMRKRADSTESAGSGFTLSREPYICSVWALHKDIGDQMRANADGAINPDRDATNWVTMKGLLRREVDFAQKFMIPGVWANGAIGISAGTPSSGEFLQWNDPSSTPIEDVRAAKRVVLQQTGFVPNKMVLGVAVFDALLDHPDIIDRIKYGQTPGQPAMADEEVLAKLFGVSEILVSRAIQNTSADGQAESNQFIVGDAALLGFVQPSPGMFVPSAAYTFSWTGLLGSAAWGGRIKRFYIDTLETTRVEIEMAFDQRTIGTDLGYLFEKAVNNPLSA